MRWRIIGCILLAVAGVFLLLGLLPRRVTAGTTPPVNLSGTRSYARFPVIARESGGTLCAAWTDNRDGSWNIYSACSENNGQSWGPPGRVYSSAQTSLYPALLFSGTVPVFVWTDEWTPEQYTLYQKMGETAVVAVPNVAQPVPRPSIARGSNGTLHLVFADRCSANDMAGDVCYTRRPAGSGDWLRATAVFTGLQGGSMDPRIAIGPTDILHVVWRESYISPAAVDEIRYMTGTVGSGGEVTWSPSVTASDVVSLAWGPEVAVTSNGDIHIVWTEKPGDERYLAYTRFNATGGRIPPQRLGGPFSVNENNPYYLAAVVAAEGERVCIAWHAVPEHSSSEDVFLRCSEDGGNTWSPPENLSRTPAMSLRPSIVVAPGGSVYVVWQELVGTDYDSSYYVYYTRWLPYSVHLPLVMRNAR